MPFYTFDCLECKNVIVLNMEISEYTNDQICDKCGSSKVRRNIKADNIMVIESEPRSLGMLAEKNAREQGIQ
jgi:putative FmdB family regulatory protein